MKRIALVVASLLFGTTAHAGTAQRETHGGREVRVDTPEGDVARRPLVVVLHGCTQTADDVADASQMDALADEKGFVVAYPEQTAESGLNRCWEWWDPANQKRDSGEPKEIADAVAAIVDARKLDATRVYIAGISAGAAMSVVLGATYPDRFTAIGVVAGIEYNAASSLSGVYGASTAGGPDPIQQGDRAHDAMGSFARVVPALVFHGDVDSVVDSVNGEQVAKQWVRTNTLVLGEGTIAEPTSTDGEAGYAYVHTVHASKERGGSVVEHILVKGLGHAWPGGKAGASYSDPKGPDATRTLWAFFEKRTLSQPIPEGAAEQPATNDPSQSPSGGNGSPAPSPSPATTSDDGGCSTTSRQAGHASWGLLVIAAACALRARRDACR